MSETGRTRLTSWKEIASHLGRDVRTVLRWEKDRGLPVHRPQGPTRRVVFAYTDELDAWMRGDRASAASADAAASAEPLPPPSAVPAHIPEVRGASRRTSAALVLLAIVAGTIVLWWSGGRADAVSEIAHVRVTDTVVEASGAGGRALWTFPLADRNSTPQPVGHIVDLNADGRADVVTSVTTSQPGGTQSGYLLALDHHGRKLWQRSVEEDWSFGAGPFSRPWVPDDLLVYRSRGRDRLAWSLHHQTWWPGVLAVFDGNGERVATFVNSGWILSLQASVDGRYLIAGGINNARAGASFAILDPEHPDGTSPEDADSPFHCTNCPPGAPIRYFVIPWSDVIHPTLLGGRRGMTQTYPNGTIELHAVQEQNAEMIVELTPEFEVKKRSVSDGFWDWHRKREHEGVLTHTRETCPFRTGPMLLEWMPEHGWREVPK